MTTLSLTKDIVTFFSRWQTVIKLTLALSLGVLSFCILSATLFSFDMLDFDPEDQPGLIAWDFHFRLTSQGNSVLSRQFIFLFKTA